MARDQRGYKFSDTRVVQRLIYGFQHKPAETAETAEVAEAAGTAGTAKAGTAGMAKTAKPAETAETAKCGVPGKPKEYLRDSKDCRPAIISIEKHTK